MSMFKSVKVSYPKKKTKLINLKVVEVPEPKRTTMYDIVLHNFKISERNTFLHRIIYFGEHSFPTDEKINSFFADTVYKANKSRYAFDKVTGLLIRYKRHFIHLIEGDEDGIFEQIGLLLHDEQNSSYLGKTKLLANIHHINCRYTNDWSCLGGSPPKLLETIDPNSPIDVTGSYVYKCVIKVYDLIERVTKTPSISVGLIKSVEDTAMSLRSIISASSSAAVSNQVKLNKNPEESSRISFLGPSRASFAIPFLLSLPEIEMIDFLLQSQFTNLLLVVYNLHRNVPQRDIYKDKVWPIAADFIPYDIFSDPYNILTKFPKPEEETETEPEQEHEEYVIDEEPEHE